MFFKCVISNAPTVFDHFLATFFVVSGVLKEVRHKFFEEWCDGCIPSIGFQSVADGTAKTIGHLLAASICNGGPGPGFLSPWVYWYLADGVGSALCHIPQKLPQEAQFSRLFEQVPVYK